MILHDVAGGGLAVDEELETGGATGAVVGDADMRPRVELELLLRADLEGVAGPEMNEREAGVTLFEHELIALVTGVRTCLLMMQHDDFGQLFRRIHPQAEGERAGALEVRERVDPHRVLAIELKCLSDFAAHALRRIGELGRMIRADEVRGLFVREIVEGVMADEPVRRGRFVAGGEPFLERARGGRAIVGERLFLRPDGLLEVAMLLLLGIVLEQERGRAGDGVGEVRVETGFLGGVEEREEPVVILLGEGIVFVIVAAGAFHREPEKSTGRRVNPVGVVLHAELFIHAAAFVRLAMQAVEGRGDLLIARGVGQQVAGDLFDDEVVEADVSVEGIDDPIPPRPEVIEAIRLIAVRVGVARDIEPFDGHALAVSRRGQQSIRNLPVGFR